MREETDALGQVTSETDANGHTERYAYTVDGLLAELTRPDGTKITNTYDETGSLVAQQAAGKTVLQQDYTEQGRRVITTGMDGQSTYQFNGNNQLTSATYPTGDTVQYAYDEYGRKTGITYPDGSAIQYAYDQMDRLSSVTEANDSITRYSYNALGQRTEESREGQSLRTTYAYDAAGNLLRQETQGNTALAFGYAYDALGRMVKEERTEGGVRLTSEYRYDKLGQLLEMTASDGYAEAYQYDAAGNMVRKQADGTRYSMRYGKANELTELRAGNQKLVYSYDENGNLREKALGGQTDQYTYDGLGNLSSYTGYDGYAQSYAYAGLGIRTEKQEKGNGNRLTLEEVLAGKTLGENKTQGTTAQGNATTNSEGWTKTSYIQDVTQPHAQVLMERTGGSTTSYVYGLDRLAGYTREADGSTLTTEYVYDGRGSVAQILTTGEVQAPEGAKPAVTLLETLSLRYSPYGEQIGTDRGSKTKAAVSGYGYNGEAYDAATGMLHLRARQYEPGMNRFSQKDLVWGHVRQPMTQNRYAYVTNDPVGYADPSGLFLSSVLKGVASAAKSVANAVTSFVRDPVGTISRAVSSVASYVSNAVSSAVSYISNAYASYGPVIDDSSSYGYSYSNQYSAVRSRVPTPIVTERKTAQDAQLEIAKRLQSTELTPGEKKILEDAQAAVKGMNINNLEQAKEITKVLMKACQDAEKAGAKEREFMETLTSTEKKGYLNPGDDERKMLERHEEFEITEKQMLNVLTVMKTKEAGTLNAQDLVDIGIFTQEEIMSQSIGDSIRNFFLGSDADHYAGFIELELTLIRNDMTYIEASKIYSDLQYAEIQRMIYLHLTIGQHLQSANLRENYIDWLGGKAEKPVYGDGYYDQMEKNILEGNPVSSGTGGVWEGEDSSARTKAPTIDDYPVSEAGYYGYPNPDSSNSSARNIDGGAAEARRMFDTISQGYEKEQIIQDGTGVVRTMSDGTTITFRESSFSADHSPAIDINNSPVLPRQKIHFP